MNLSNDEYKNYSKLTKIILYDCINLNNYYSYEYYIKKYNFIKDTKLLKIQYNYLIEHLPCQIIPLYQLKLNNIEYEKLQDNYNKIIRPYNLLDTKKLDNNLIIYSYFCYFKTAINVLIHHPLFKNKFNIISDENPILKQKGGSYLNELLNKKINIIDTIKSFNLLVNQDYLIGIPGIKYYPHQILQEILNLMNNDFSNQFIIKQGKNIRHITTFLSNKYLIDDYKDYNDNEIFNLYQEQFNYLLNNYDNILIAPITNDPLIFNCFTIINQKHIKYKNIKNITDKNIKDAIKNKYIYNYPFIKNNHLLNSFCIVENIINKPPLKSLTFHSVFFNLEYDNNNNLIDIIRYDNFKIKKSDNNKPSFFINELKYIFNDNGINDYFDGNNNYKICLLSYIKKMKNKFIN